MPGGTSPVSHTFDTQQGIKGVLVWSMIPMDDYIYNQWENFPIYSLFPEYLHTAGNYCFVKYNWCACE